MTLYSGYGMPVKAGRERADHLDWLPVYIDQWTPRSVFSGSFLNDTRFLEHGPTYTDADETSSLTPSWFWW